MSWRRFAVLLRGLSPLSVYVNLQGEAGTRVIDAKNAHSFFAMFGKRGS